MSNSDDVDLDAYSPQRKRDEIERLDQLGADCKSEQQYAKAERFYERALELAESIADLSLTIKERHYVADMQRMQGKYQSALSLFLAQIQIVYSPEIAQELTETDLWYVANGFIKFVEIGSYLPDMKIVDLERVLEQGLEWLNRIDKRSWSAGLRLQRGRFLVKQGRHEAALEEFEAALAIKRRSSDDPSYSLGSYIFNLATHLGWELQQFEEAEQYHREVVEGHEFGNYDKHRSWRELASIALEKQDFAMAEIAAQQALELAQQIESSHPLYATYSLLGQIFLMQNQIDRAITANIQAWHYVRQWREAAALHELYVDFAQVRKFQAQQNQSPRYILKAKCWLHWALPLAKRLDRQTGSTDRQRRIQELRDECNVILAEE